MILVSILAIVLGFRQSQYLYKALAFFWHCSGVGQSGVPDGLITHRSVVQIHSPLIFFGALDNNLKDKIKAVHMLKLGIDESGRGPVVGPLIIAGVVIDVSDEHLLAQANVKDSKLLTQAQRLKARKVIEKIAKQIEIVKLSPDAIDSSLAAGINLNQLEGLKAAEIINKCNADVIIMDCPSPNILAYSGFLGGMIKNPDKLILEHQADKNHIAVSAASVIAKVEREAEIEKIKKDIGIDFGSGYSSDPRTIEFLQKHHSAFPIFRKSWQTWKDAASGRQSNLFDF